MLSDISFLITSPQHLACFLFGVFVTFSLKFGFAIFDTTRTRAKLKDLMRKHKSRIRELERRAVLEKTHCENLLSEAYKEKTELYNELERVIKEKENLISAEIERLKIEHAFEIENLHKAYTALFSKK